MEHEERGMCKLPILLLRQLCQHNFVLTFRAVAAELPNPATDTTGTTDSGAAAVSPPVGETAPNAAAAASSAPEATAPAAGTTPPTANTTAATGGTGAAGAAGGNMTGAHGQTNTTPMHTLQCDVLSASQYSSR